MKFAEHLGAHITPEWRKQYIQYEDMKAMLYAAMEQAPSQEVVEEEVSQRYFASFDEKFFTFCDKELTKINTFYAEKLAEATRKFATLKSEMEESEKSSVAKKKVHRRKLMDLKLAFSEFYLSLILLQNYQNLNFTGFRKILKKHDKLLRNNTGARWREEFVESAHFHTNKDIDKLISDTEATVTTDLEGGDRQKAMKRLRVPPLGDKHSPWTTFKVGLFAGAFLVLFIAVILSAVFHSPENTIDEAKFNVIVKLYRGPLLFILFLFLMGINVYGWRSSGVNHVLIFELDPRNHLSEQDLFELATTFGVLWTMSILCFLYADSLGVEPFVMPVFLVGIMILFMLNPTRTLKHDARFWSLKVISRIFLAPFFYVGFADFWLADQMNSLAHAMKDFQFLVCYYISFLYDGVFSGSTADTCSFSGFWLVAVVGMLPAWFRFAQCLRRYRDTREAFPHLANMGKYSTTIITGILSCLRHNYDDDDENVFYYLYLISQTISSIYGYIWDIKMDWGFFAANAGENRFLREEIVYSSTNYYYFAIVEDLVIRFSWVYLLVIKSYMDEYDYHIPIEIIVTFFACLEVMRRFIWNFFRLENEHLNNCGKFRAVRDISVAPIDASDQALIIKLMDDPNPKDLFRNRKKVGKKPNYAKIVESPLLEDTDDRELNEPLTINFSPSGKGKKA